MSILESAGFNSIRSAASKGVFDVIGWNPIQTRFIQVKAGKNCTVSAVEREALTLEPVPANATKEIWRFPDRCRAPLIEVISGSR